MRSQIYAPATIFTAIIFSFLITATLAAPLTATSSSIDLRNTTTTPSDSPNNSTILGHLDGSDNDTCQSPLTRQQGSSTPNPLNYITYIVPNTSPKMTLLFFSFGPRIPRTEFQFSNVQAVAAAAAPVHSGKGKKLIAHGFWKFRTYFEDVAWVEYAVADHSQLGEEKAMNYNELVSAVRGVGYFTLETARYEGLTFDVSIAGRGGVGVGHVERALQGDIGDGSGCESNVTSGRVAVTR